MGDSPVSDDGTRASHTLPFVSPSPLTGMRWAWGATGGGTSPSDRECRSEDKKPSFGFSGCACDGVGIDGDACDASADPDGHITFPEPEMD